ncbi:hypothetical protein [Celerinatantimonas sp. YJH-8]|uniref:hypothetical protein n=1 Tax=Celerinatantimonas sp. YJH-8 TaxID=3228714 RepID=UPI0038C60278
MDIIPISQTALNEGKRKYDNAGLVVKPVRFIYHYDDYGRVITTIEKNIVSVY